MPKTKTQAEAPDRAAPAPVVEHQRETPEKQGGPSPAARMPAPSALPPPNGAPPPARAADLMTAPEGGPGAPGWARMTTAMQETVGNARLGRMLGTTPSPPEAMVAPPATETHPTRTAEPTPTPDLTEALTAPSPAVDEPLLPEASRAPTTAPAEPSPAPAVSVPSPTPPVAAEATPETPPSPEARTEAPSEAKVIPVVQRPAEVSAETTPKTEAKPTMPAPEPGRPAVTEAGRAVEAPAEAEGEAAPEMPAAAEAAPQISTPEGAPMGEAPEEAPTEAALPTPSAPAGAAETAGAAPTAEAAAEAGVAKGAPPAAKGAALAGAPPAGAGGPEAAPPTPPSIDTSSPEGLLQSLATVPVSSFGEAVSMAQAAAPEIQAREKTDLEASFPEIERPTGLPRRSEEPEGEPTELEPGEAPEAESAGGREGEPPETRHEEAAGPVPGSQVSTSVSEPVEEEEGSWWEWLINRVRNFLSQLPTSDSGLSTSAGPRPNVDLSGDADPAQNQQQQQASDQEITTERADADAATMADFGETDIYPTVPEETLRPAYKPGPPPPAADGGEAKMPAVRDDARDAFDEGAAPWLHGKVQEQLDQHRQDKAAYQQQSAQIREDGRRKIAEETKRVRGEQKGVQQQARSDVDTQREQWREENRKIQEEYATKSQAKRLDVDKQIHEKVQTTETQADKTLTDAEHQAEQERIKAEAKAAAKKREAENKPRSWWDRVKGAVSDVFNAIKKAVNAIFDALRKLVKDIIEAAKAVVRGIIEAARLAIVGLIKGFGEALKGFVTIALAAFPETAAKARAWIDDKVDGAVDAVNEAADALKQATDAILDWVGEALDTALAVVQAAFNLALDVLEFLALAVFELLELLAKLVDLVRKIGPMIETIWDLIQDPTPVIEAIKTFIGGLIAEAPGQAISIARAAISFSDPPENHWEGIWNHLKPKLDYLAAQWWEVLKKTAWHLIWPFAEDSPIWEEVPELWNLFGEALESIWKGQISKAIDQYLRIVQLLNSIISLFYGWIFIGLVVGYAIAGGIAAAEVGVIPGIIAGAAAGAEIAGAIGLGLLIAAAATEGAIIAKAGFDLIFTSQTEEENEEDYERIANSALSLALIGAMVLLSEVALRFVRAMIRAIKRAGRFVRGEPKTPTPKERRAAMREAAEERARVKEIKEGVEKVDDELANGTHRRTIPKEDLDWLNADPSGRRKELAYDPDIGSYRVNEAKAALQAEEQGVLPRPVRRSTTPDTDFIDGSGSLWSHKGASRRNTTTQNVEIITAPARRGTGVLGDLRGLNPVEAALVRARVRAELARVPGAGEVRFVPPGPSPAAVGGAVVGKEVGDVVREEGQE